MGTGRHEVMETIDAMRRWVLDARRSGRRVGFVPTMGALHDGHLSLVRAAKSDNDLAVVSIFVNPIQFGPGEDLARYPRDLDGDCRMLQRVNADAVFAPADEEMYPGGQILTYVEPQRLDRNLCGLARPGHFRGVCTVVTKLFQIVPADAAYFGRKDAQQAAIVCQMVKDLNLPITIVVCPIVREPDGLAMSSRNRYLSGDDRSQAVALYQSLRAAEDLIRGGERTAESILAAVRRTLGQFGRVQPEYVSVVDPDTMEDLVEIRGRALVAVAARVGKTRLIDNLLVDVGACRFEL